MPSAYPGGCLNSHVGVPFVSVAYLDVIICGIHLIIMTIYGNFSEVFFGDKYVVFIWENRYAVSICSLFLLYI